MNHAHEGSPPADQEFADALPEDSIAVETSMWDYDYGDLEVFSIFGALDNGAAKRQGKYYREVLLPNNDVSSVELQGVGHEVHWHPDGTEQIFIALSGSCYATLP